MRRKGQFMIKPAQLMMLIFLAMPLRTCEASFRPCTRRERRGKVRWIRCLHHSSLGMVVMRKQSPVKKNLKLPRQGLKAGDHPRSRKEMFFTGTNVFRAVSIVDLISYGRRV